jgi:hypothetical protein
MRIAENLGLTNEAFCRMVITTKMLFSNVLGHAAELHYEKDLIARKYKYEKAPTDVPYDYIVDGKKDQVKRFETNSTSTKFVGVNLTKTHGDRSGSGGYYSRGDFDRLIILDVGLSTTYVVLEKDIPNNPKYPGSLPGKLKLPRVLDEKLIFETKFLNAMKFANSKFPDAIELLRSDYKMSYSELLSKSCDLTIDEIDSLFCFDNFRLVVGARGFAGEEHFNMLLDSKKILYKQMKDMYCKHDHLVMAKVKVQVKTLHGRSTDENFYGFKTHKSHGHGVGELIKKNEFDYIALFVGFEMDETHDHYVPKSAKTEFIFIPAKDLEEHPNFPGYLKRVTRIPKLKYKINDLSIFK